MELEVPEALGTLVIPARQDIRATGPMGLERLEALDIQVILDLQVIRAPQGIPVRLVLLELEQLVAPDTQGIPDSQVIPALLDTRVHTGPAGNNRLYSYTATGYTGFTGHFGSTGIQVVPVTGYTGYNWSYRHCWNDR